MYGFIDGYDFGETNGAVCEPEEDVETEFEKVHNELVRSLIEAGGEIRQLKEDKATLVHYLKETLNWVDYFLTANPDDIYFQEASADRWAAECYLMNMEDQ